MRPTLPLLVALAPVLAGLFLFGLEISNARVIVQGMHAGDIALGGLAPETSERLLGENIDRFLQTPLTITVAGMVHTTTPKALGTEIDVQASIQNAYAIGRNAPLLLGLWQQLTTLLTQPTIPLVVRLDEETYHKETKRLFAEQEKPVINAYPSWDGATLTTAAQRSGISVNRHILAQELVWRTAFLDSAPLVLFLQSQRPTIAQHETAEALNEAQSWLEHTPVRLTASDRTFLLLQNDLASLLVFTRTRDNKVASSLDHEKTILWLSDTVAQHIAREPQDARFEVSGRRVTVFRPARSGIALDAEGSVQMLLQALRDNTRPVELAVVETDPNIRTQDANELGIVALLGKGESDFARSPQNRIHNIRTGAARFNGVLISPGEEFSFNQVLGPVTQEAGYKAELVILQDKTVPALGGGLCQVSTTAFRAAVYSGLEITQRRSHSYIVRYYGTPGFDATIYPPNPDLKFRNDTQGHILIQTRTEGTKLIFEFYGTPDGRSV